MDLVACGRASSFSSLKLHQQRVVRMVALPDIRRLLSGTSFTDVNGVEHRRREDGGWELTLRGPQRPASVHFVRGASPFAAMIPGDSVAEQVITSGISSFLGLYNVALIGRILLTWFPQAPEPIVRPLATVVDPYLNLFRGIIPPLGGTIDLSPILAFIVLDLFSNSATALSAEVGPDGQLKRPERMGPIRIASARRRQLAATAERRRLEAGQQQ